MWKQVKSVQVCSSTGKKKQWKKERMRGREEGSDRRRAYKNWGAYKMGGGVREGRRVFNNGEGDCIRISKKLVVEPRQMG